MLSLHFKLIFWFVNISLFAYLCYKDRSRLLYKLKELKAKLSSRVGRGIFLNESFSDDLEAGLSSTNFDIISENSSDGRLGLDESAKSEIKELMQKENISFDKARLLYMEKKFGKNGIAPDGTPMDPKAVTFASSN